jgi:hypothetical protein
VAGDGSLVAAGEQRGQIGVHRAAALGGATAGSTPAEVQGWKGRHCTASVVTRASAPSAGEPRHVRDCCVFGVFLLAFHPGLKAEPI